MGPFLDLLSLLGEALVRPSGLLYRSMRHGNLPTFAGKLARRTPSFDDDSPIRPLEKSNRRPKQASTRCRPAPGDPSRRASDIADGVRCGHIRASTRCAIVRFGNRAATEHASPHLAAHPRQARTDSLVRREERSARRVDATRLTVWWAKYGRP
jgi:hypothetical protein